MKKLNLFISLVLLITLFSCTKELNTDDAFDLKASKMEQIGTLFESISRQPESAKILVSSAEMLYTDYTKLLPLTDKAVVQRGKARGSAFGKLFLSISMQPEAYNDLEAAALKFLGKYDPSYINDELNDITRTYSSSSLQTAIYRSPQTVNLLKTICKKYLNYDLIIVQ